MTLWGGFIIFVVGAFVGYVIGLGHAWKNW
jgi:hypothetical protein